MRTTEAIVAGPDHLARLVATELPGMTGTRVRIKTMFGGVSCGTEADCTSGRAVYMPRPFISGYQAVGTVVETGPLVRKVQAGDRVFTSGGGLWNCTHLAGGSHARELVVEDGDVIKLSPQSPSLPTTAYAALGAIALEGLSRMKLEPGRTLLIFGLGMLGQLAGRLAQLRGLRVIGVNRSAWKRDLARAMGFDAVCAPGEDAIKDAIRALGFGGAAYAVDLTGCQAIFDLALGQLEQHGELTLLGYYPDKFTVNLDLFHARQITLHNPVGPGNRLPEIIRLIENGLLNVEPLIRHRVKPGECTAFYRDLIQNHSDYLGAILEWEQPVNNA